ncbi:motile sperm domain-containing protein 2-like isoform X4 [Condylostylus longicornis]|uniref:motile sperm domain-containing protein 2-like isoform X4 n=1 Tax=Condylostylus longicornis TaxID=2530218 RepID=UPI00244DFEA8|nr:motile sperm domain-containing protein 2-like isoform X4 [Condylostylus longicornis]
MPEPTPTLEQIETLRDLFFKKLEKEPPSCDGSFHPDDIERAKSSNKWLQLFLEQTDLDMKQALNMLWETCIWRKTFGTNDINENNIRLDYMDVGAMFAKKQDIDGKYLIIVRSKLHQKGTKDMNELIRILVYWIERIHRETDYDQLTLFFDMSSAGLSNMDMDFTKRTIDTFKYYYPNSLNYIIIFEMPWILNAAFKIIKGLLPPKAVAKMKFLNTKNIKEYIPDSHCLKIWGGNVDYEFKLIPEVRNSNKISSTTTIQQQSQAPKLNGNPFPSPASSISSTEGVGHTKKVHFANPSPPDSPMTDSAAATTYAVGSDGEMLQLKPEDSIIFNKSENNEYAGTVDITNVTSNSVTYKIKTTSPEKFRVKPSSGILAPGHSASIHVILQPGQQISVMSKDKFLVMCMQMPEDVKPNIQAITELWKNTPPTSLQIEQHRLKCTLPNQPIIGDGFKNGRIVGGHIDSNDIPGQIQNLSSTLCQQVQINQKLQSQLKFTQTLQWILLIAYIILSIGIVYVLKKEINEQTAGFFDKDCTNSQPHQEL